MTIRDLDEFLIRRAVRKADLHAEYRRRRTQMPVSVPWLLVLMAEIAAALGFLVYWCALHAILAP